MREEPWLATSLRPENFVPGLLIGFLLGVFLDLSSARRSGYKGKFSSVPGKQRSLASCNGGEELKMLSTNWAETADNARSAARSFVLCGLSEKCYGLSDFWVADRINDIDSEALAVLNNCYERAKKILQHNRDLMDALVDQLVQKKSITKQEFSNLVEEKGHLDPMPQSIVDIRITKRMQFQEMMMGRK